MTTITMDTGAVVKARVIRVAAEVQVELMGATRGERMVFAHSLLAVLHQEVCCVAYATRVFPDARVVTVTVDSGSPLDKCRDIKTASSIEKSIVDLLPGVR